MYGFNYNLFEFSKCASKFIATEFMYNLFFVIYVTWLCSVYQDIEEVAQEGVIRRNGPRIRDKGCRLIISSAFWS